MPRGARGRRADRLRDRRRDRRPRGGRHSRQRLGTADRVLGLDHLAILGRSPRSAARTPSAGATVALPRMAKLRRSAGSPRRRRSSSTSHQTTVATPTSPWHATPARAQGEPAPDGVGAIRVIRSARPALREEVVAYRRPSRSLVHGLSGAPIRDHMGTVSDAGRRRDQDRLRGADDADRAARRRRPRLRHQAGIKQLLNGVTTESERLAATPMAEGGADGRPEEAKKPAGKDQEGARTKLGAALGKLRHPKKLSARAPAPGRASRRVLVLCGRSASSIAYEG